MKRITVDWNGFISALNCALLWRHSSNNRTISIGRFQELVDVTKSRLFLILFEISKVFSLDIAPSEIKYGIRIYFDPFDCKVPVHNFWRVKKFHPDPTWWNRVKESLQFQCLRRILFFSKIYISSRLSVQSVYLFKNLLFIIIYVGFSKPNLECWYLYFGLFLRYFNENLYDT